MARGQFARRVGAALLKQQRRQASTGGPFWSDGKQTGHNGYLFNETPPPPGESRVMEGWEMPWYASSSAGSPIARACARLARMHAQQPCGRNVELAPFCFHDFLAGREHVPMPAALLTPCACAVARYIAFGSATIILGVGLNSKPNTSLSAWAREEAKKDLAAKA